MEGMYSHYIFFFKSYLYLILNSISKVGKKYRYTVCLYIITDVGRYIPETKSILKKIW